MNYELKIKIQKFSAIFLAVIVSSALASAPSAQSAPAPAQIKIGPDVYISPSALMVVTIKNPNPKNLSLRAKYGEVNQKKPEETNLNLKSNTFAMDDDKPEIAWATLTGLRAGRLYYIKIVDNTGNLLPSDTFSFTAPSTGFGGYYSAPLPPPTGTNTTPTESPQNEPIILSATPAPRVNPYSKYDPNYRNVDTYTPLYGQKNTGGTTAGTGAKTPKEFSGGLVPCDNSDKKCEWNELMELVNRVIKYVFFFLVLPIVAIMFAYAGIQMIFAGGGEAMTKARNTFSNAVIGFLIALGAWLIINTILRILGFDGSWIGFD